MEVKSRTLFRESRGLDTNAWTIRCRKESGAMSILIVDDTIDHRVMIERLLHNAGYKHTATAESAEDAFEQLGIGGLRPAPPSVDVILMDIMMTGIDGLEACRRIKADPRLADIPVIMITANTDTDRLRQAFTAGATDYIRKPIIQVELIARVCTVLTMKFEMAMRKRREHDLEMAIQELKALRGCIPICASCKRIRGASGSWQTPEEFLKASSDLKIDDTLCHHCVEQWKQDEAA